MDSDRLDGRNVVALGDEATVAGSDDLPFEVVSASTTSVDDRVLSDAGLLIIGDQAGLDRIKGSYAATPTVAFVTDPTGPIATDPIVDAVATTPTELTARIRWLLARKDRAHLHDERADGPSRMERLQAGAARLATARSPEDAYRIAVVIAEGILPVEHSIAGVARDDWIEPVAVSTGEDPDDRNRIRVGEGIAGKTVAEGEPTLDGTVDHDRYGSALTVPVGEEGVLQMAAADSDAFDRRDLQLAELLASHLEETLSRLRADEALRAERDRLFALFENIPDAAVIYDYVDDVLLVDRVNPAFEETFGYSAEEIVGEPIDEYILPADDEAVIGEAQELNARLRRGQNLRCEVTRRTTSGDRHFILHVVPIRLGAENASGYAIYTDVTERREREATLQRQNERLDAFTSIVTHDLRNPLSIAKGHLDLARTLEEPERLERVEAALDRMDELITELLSLSRDGRVVGAIEELSLETVAREAWSHVETADSGLVVDEDLRFEADRTRVRELFENLFRNSIEHGTGGEQAGTDTGTTPLTVEVGPLGADGDPDGERFHDGPTGLYVEDDGSGFDGDPGRVFESGYTTEDNGTGLGLAITEHVAEAHGWSIEAVPVEPTGARFEFRFDSSE